MICCGIDPTLAAWMAESDEFAEPEIEDQVLLLAVIFGWLSLTALILAAHA